MDGLVNGGVVVDEITCVRNGAIDGRGREKRVGVVPPDDDGEHGCGKWNVAGGGFRRRSGCARRARRAGQATGTAGSAGSARTAGPARYDHAGTGADYGGGAGEDVVYLERDRQE